MGKTRFHGENRWLSLTNVFLKMVKVSIGQVQMWKTFRLDFKSPSQKYLFCLRDCLIITPGVKLFGASSNREITVQAKRSGFMRCLV
jgi:hypothetical protein